MRPVCQRLDAGVHDVRQDGPHGEAVGLPEVQAAGVQTVRAGRAGRVAAPVRAVRVGGVRQSRRVHRRVAHGGAGAAQDVRRGQLLRRAVQRLRAHVRRGQRHRGGRLLFGHVREMFRARRSPKCGKAHQRYTGGASANICLIVLIRTISVWALARTYACVCAQSISIETPLPLWYSSLPGIFCIEQNIDRFPYSPMTQRHIIT